MFLPWKGSQKNIFATRKHFSTPSICVMGLWDPWIPCLHGTIWARNSWHSKTRNSWENWWPTKCGVPPPLGSHIFPRIRQLLSVMEFGGDQLREKISHLAVCQSSGQQEGQKVLQYGLCCFWWCLICLMTGWLWTCLIPEVCILTASWLEVYTKGSDMFRSKRDVIIICHICEYVFIEKTTRSMSLNEYWSTTGV